MNPRANSAKSAFADYRRESPKGRLCNLSARLQSHRESGGHGQVGFLPQFTRLAGPDARKHSMNLRQISVKRSQLLLF